MSYIKKIVVAAACLTAFSCTNLEEVDPASFSGDNFPSPNNPDTYVALLLDPVTQLRNMFDHYWRVQECASDEFVVPKRGSDFANVQWVELHKMTWTKNLSIINQCWQWGFGAIGRSNNILKLMQGAPESIQKPVFIAQVRAMRALYYFYMMDMFGNIPVSEATDLSEGLPVTKPRAEVFAYIEKELTESLASLPADVSSSTYGLPTKWMAHALLAKLYINAEVYTGTARYADAVTQCDVIIQSSKFALAPATEWWKMFHPDNSPTGAGNKEFVFAMPNDAQKGSRLSIWRWTLPKAMKAPLGYKIELFNGFCTLPEFYNKYNDPNDVRQQIWMVGKLTDNAKNPVIVFDDVEKKDVQLEIIPDVKFGSVAGNTFDIGSTYDGSRQGARCLKYLYDTNANADWAGNDYLIFRYADIWLMRAEADARVKNDASVALAAVNQLRASRGAAALSSLTFDTLLDERARELAWEGWRRNDLIRFGKFETKWGIKTNTNINQRIFPIPQNQMNINPALVQNPGY